MPTLWSNLMRCQVDMTLPLELPFYYTSPDWLQTTSVLDLGTGTGYYLGCLRNLFPEKRFTGVDIDFGGSDLHKRENPEGIEFLERDLFALSGSHPFVISRLVAQHQRSVGDFLCQVSSLIQSGGIFLTVEPADGLRTFVPGCRAIQDLYGEFLAHRREDGFDREAGLTMVSMAAEFKLDVIQSSAVAIPSTLPGHRKLFVEFHRLIFDVFEGEYGVIGDRCALLEELHTWERNPYSYAQLGIQLGLFRKR